MRYAIGSIRKAVDDDGNEIFLVSQTWIAKIFRRPMIVTLKQLKEYDKK